MAKPFHLSAGDYLIANEDIETADQFEMKSLMETKNDSVSNLQMIGDGNTAPYFQLNIRQPTHSNPHVENVDSCIKTNSLDSVHTIKEESFSLEKLSNNGTQKTDTENFPSQMLTRVLSSASENSALVKDLENKTESNGAIILSNHNHCINDFPKKEDCLSQSVPNGREEVYVQLDMSSEGDLTAESKPVRKSQRRVAITDTTPCPVCNISIKSAEINDHIQLEVTRLDKWTSDYRRKNKKRLSSDTLSTELKFVSRKKTKRQNYKDNNDSEEEYLDPEARYESFLKVKRNREKRKPGPDQPQRDGTECPVCNKRIMGNQQEVNRHVNLCLVKEDGEVDIEGSSGEEGYEEYEWCGETRIRATSLLNNHLTESGYTVGKAEDTGGNDEELNIDDDDTDVYGSTQYCESDLILCAADGPKEEKERQAIRKRLLQGEKVSVESSCQSSDTNQSCNSSQSCDTKDVAVESEKDLSAKTNEELLAEIKSLRKELAGKSDKFKCLICMEVYEKPVTSIQCWHVYCEECWLRTLGAKKLCPQCNNITHPSDLRKIFL